MKAFLKLSSLVLVSFIFQSCFSLNTHQSAKTLGKGEMSIQLINGASGVPAFVEDPNSAISNGFSTSQFQLALGVKENIDLGITLGVNKLGFLSKYQILGDKDSKFALGSGTYVYRSFGNTIDFNNMYAVEIPLFLSYHPSQMISIYSNPLISYFNIEEEGIISLLDVPFYQTGAYKGLSSGLIFDIPLKSFGIGFTTSIDLSWMAPLESNRYLFYTTLGVGVKFKTGWFNSSKK